MVSPTWCYVHGGTGLLGRYKPLVTATCWTSGAWHFIVIKFTQMGLPDTGMLTVTATFTRECSRLLHMTAATHMLAHTCDFSHMLAQELLMSELDGAAS
jgi:hypothetical protein